MSRERSLDLLTQNCQMEGMDISLKQMEKLYTHLGGNPLALMWSLGQLQQTEQQVDRFLQRLAVLRAKAEEDENEQRLLNFCFHEAFERRSPEAKTMLLSLSVFPMPLTIMETHAVLPYDAASCKHALEELDTYSLVIHPQNEQVAIQPLARRYLARELNKNYGETFKNEVRRRYADQYAQQHSNSQSNRRFMCVFTPDYLPRRLPEGATPVDFAYSIHTELGHHYERAEVDGQAVSENYVLTGGEIVKIIPDQSASPNPDWKVRTSRARRNIKAFFAQPREAEKAVRVANALCLRGKLHEALDKYERAVTLDPHNTWARNRLGHCLRLLGEEEKAMQQYRAVLSHDPPNTNVYALVGKACLLYQRRDVEGAWKLYNHAWELRPDYVNALFGMARCCCRSKRYAEAENYLTKALQQPVVDRQTAALHLFRAVALLGLGRTDDAINKALAISVKIYEKLMRKRVDLESFSLNSASSGLHALAYYAIGLVCAGSSQYEDYLKLLLNEGAFPGLVAETLMDPCQVK